VISVVSPKGGVGKTTVAVNLAVGLARSAPKATVLVDLDIQFGDVASGLNLDPEYFLPSAVHEPAISDTMVLKTFLTLHETGLYVICAPESPVEADGITADQVRQLLRTLAAEFRYVVVDTAPGLAEHTLAAMDETTDLVMLSSMDVPGLRGLRKEIDTLRDLGLLQERRHQVLINFANPSAGLSAADIEVTIGAPVDLVLPRSKAAPASVNLGVPLLQSGTRDPMTKKLRALVEHFTRGESTDRPPASVRKLKTSTPVPRRAASGWFRRPRAAAS
jgi:pilus assembly protein CpaE